MKPEPFSNTMYMPILALLIFLSFFAHLGSIPLFDADEGAYCEVTREMLAKNDFTTALLNDRPFFHKPPLFFWAQAASIGALGLSETALRLPSAVAALLWAGSIFLFTRRFCGTRSAWHATLFMASSLLVTLVGRAAAPEAMFCLFLTLVLLNIYRYHHTGSRRHVSWAFMFLGLAVLVKGTVALLIPVTVSLVFFMVKKKRKEFRQLLFNPVGLLVFGLIVFPWYLAEFMMHGKTFLVEMLIPLRPEDSRLNFIGGSLPLYTYPALLLFGLMPYTGLFIKALAGARKLMEDDLVQFMAAWFLVAFFSSPLFRPGSPVTLVYSLPPLFIIMARVSGSVRQSFNLFIWPLVLIGFLCIIPDLAPYFINKAGSGSVPAFTSEILSYFDAYYRLTLGAILLLLTALPFMTAAPFHTKSAILGLLFVGIVHFLVLPILGSTVQQPIKSAALLAGKEKLDVVTWKIDPPSFNLYAEMLTSRKNPGPGDVVLTKTAYLQNYSEYETLFEKHGIILARINAME